jgi:hypothetical protein
MDGEAIFGGSDLKLDSLQWAKHDDNEDGFKKGNGVGSVGSKSDRGMGRLASPFTDSAITFQLICRSDAPLSLCRKFRSKVEHAGIFSRSWKNEDCGQRMQAS